jgi:hypothetical protein
MYKNVIFFHYLRGEEKLSPCLFVEKQFFFGKWIPGKVNSEKVNSGKVFSDVW